MREIKFRGKVHPEFNENFFKEQFVYGSLILSNDELFSVIINENFQAEVFTETVGQFTGIHDKTGKEVYEGDIVKYKVDGMQPGETEEYIEEVIFVDGGFCVDGYAPVSVIKDFDGEVIGNIHEDLPLLLQ